MATNISQENSQTSLTTDHKASGDCPICGGMGFVTYNLPVDHPNFGKAFPCVCQHDVIAARQARRLNTLSNLPAVADKTFETFILERPYLDESQLSDLRTAYTLAWNYAHEPHGWLLFQGNYGTGKTHLAAGIANHAVKLGRPVLFLTVPDLLDHLRSTFSPTSEVEYDELFDQIRAAPLLILDDFGAESTTPWAHEKLYQLIDHRYLHKLPTVFTTNCNMNDIDPRIRSRVEDNQLSQIATLNLPDFRRQLVPDDHLLLQNLALYEHMVFESFDLRENTLPEKEQTNLRKVFDAAVEYAQNPQNWLLLFGVHGCGKTHLAAAIGNYRRSHGQPVVFVTMPDLLDYLREAFNPNATSTFSQRFNEIRTAPLLIFDQLELSSSATPWAREKLRQIADYRYLTRLPTVFTTTQLIEDLDPMLRSRVSDERICYSLVILAPDYRGGKDLTRTARRRPDPN